MISMILGSRSIHWRFLYKCRIKNGEFRYNFGVVVSTQFGKIPGSPLRVFYATPTAAG
jgi:hypothetical protein